MDMKLWALTAGIGVTAGAVAVLMMPRTSPARKLAARAANKAEDVVFRLEDQLSDLTDGLDL